MLLYILNFLTTDPPGYQEFSSNVIKVTDKVKSRSKFAQILSVR